MQVKVQVKDNSRAWLAMEKQNLANATYAMGEAITKLAEVKAPILTGALKSDGRVVKTETGVEIVYGDSRVPYARRRHFENKKNPQTKYYLQEAGDTITKRGLEIYL